MTFAFGEHRWLPHRGRQLTGWKQGRLTGYRR